MLSIKLIKLAAFFSWRSLTSGRNLVYFLALSLAVSCISLVAWLNTGLTAGLNQQQTQALGGEITLSLGSQQTPSQLADFLLNQGYKFTQQLSLTSLISSSEEMQLTKLISLDANYPLMGKVELNPVINLTSPALGEIWLEPSLATRLKVKLGDFIEVGTSELKFTAEVLAVPEHTNSFISFAPKAWVSQASLSASSLLGAFSRFENEIYLLTPEYLSSQPTKTNDLAKRLAEINRFLTENNLNLEASLSNEKISLFNKALLEFKDFLLVLSLASLVLAALASLLASAGQQQQLSQSFALLTSLGLTSWQALVVVLVSLTCLAASAGFLGLVLGYAGLHLLAGFLAELLPFNLLDLATQSWQSILISWLAGIALAWCLAATPLQALLNLNTWQALQGKGENLPTWGRLNISLSLALLAALAVWLSQAVVFNLLGLAVLLFSALLLAFLGWLLLLALKITLPNLPWSLRTALQRLAVNSSTSLVQLASFTLVLSFLLLISRLSYQLMDDWQNLTPANQPNVFALDIPPASKQEFSQVLAQHNLTASQFYPLTRARLTRVNGLPVSQALTSQALKDNALNRELNLTWLANLPEENQLIAGNWWQATTDKNFISLEEGLAKRLDLKLGDKLGFNLAGSLIEAEVLNLRKVNWQNMRPNFFVIFSQASFQELSANYLVSFHLPENKIQLLSELNKTFPNTTFIDLRQVIAQLNQLLQQFSKVLNLVLVFALSAGLLVTLALLGTTKALRKKETFLLRVFGATTSQLQWRLRLEFTLLGMVAGCFASFLSEAVYAVLGYNLLQFTWQPSYLSLVLTPLVSGLFLSFLVGLTAKGLLKEG